MIQTLVLKMYRDKIELKIKITCKVKSIKVKVSRISNYTQGQNMAGYGLILLQDHLTDQYSAVR